MTNNAPVSFSSVLKEIFSRYVDVCAFRLSIAKISLVVQMLAKLDSLSSLDVISLEFFVSHHDTTA